MIYIITGVDCAGKSTCFEAIKNECKAQGKNDVVFIKESFTPSIEERVAKVERTLELSRTGKVVVYDRATILDDMVYNPLTEGKESPIKKLDKAVAGLRECTIIYLDCDNETLKKRLRERGDEYVTENDVVTLKKRYQELFRELDISPCVIDVSCLYPHEVVNEVKKVIFKKKSKIAHIVPLGSLNKILDNGYFMCLAHLIKESAQYAAFYHRRSEEGKYVLMDNGAAENSQLSNEELVQCYLRVLPTEMVLPDTLLDSADTIRKVEEGLQYFRRANVACKFMAVPQGKTLDEWKTCAEYLIRLSEVNSLGVSKFLEMNNDDEWIRYKAVAYLEELIKKYDRYDLEVHLLGCSERPCVIGKIMKDFDFVRGCDSAYAYIATQAGVPVYSETSRPSGEIDFLAGVDYGKLESNMQGMELGAGILNNALDTTWLIR